MVESGYDDGLVHGHSWASEPFGYSPRPSAVNNRLGAPLTREATVGREGTTAHQPTPSQASEEIARYKRQATAARLAPSPPLFAGGKSFGGYKVSRAQAETPAQ